MQPDAWAIVLSLKNNGWEKAHYLDIVTFDPIGGETNAIRSVVSVIFKLCRLTNEGFGKVKLPANNCSANSEVVWGATAEEWATFTSNFSA